MQYEKIVIYFICLMFICASLSGCADKKENEQAQISYISASYAIDVTDPEELVNSADYIFVGTVQNIEDTEYYDYSYAPYTTYQVDITESLKGNLQEGTCIDIVKDGGLSEDQTTFYIYEEDVIPEEGHDYLFLAFLQTDGTILVTGDNSTFSVDGYVSSNSSNNSSLRLQADDPYDAISELCN